MGIEINPVVDLAAALTNEGKTHVVEESETAADVGGGFTAGEIPGGCGARRNFSDGIGRLWSSRWRP
jgi:hypothetical protein